MRFRGLLFPEAPSRHSKMRRFFFHLMADDLKIPDLIGVELKDTAAARLHAEAQLADLWAQRVLAGQAPLTGWLEVVDQEERAVLNLRL